MARDQVLTDSQLADLIQCPEARQFLIVEMIPVALRAIARYKGFVNYQELKSTAMEALIDAVDKYTGPPGPQLRYWIISQVRNAAYRELMWLHTGRENTKKLKYVPPESKIYVEGFQAEEVEAKELHQAIVQSPLDHLILNLKLSGHDDKTVARLSGLSRATVNRMLNKMKERAREFLDEKD